MYNVEKEKELELGIKVCILNEFLVLDFWFKKWKKILIDEL